MRRGGIALAVLVCAAIAFAPAAHADRYSFAGGCYSLGAPGGQQLRFQASDLGSYLLYTPSAQFLAAGAGNTVGPVGQPSPAADWVVEDAAGGGYTLSPKSAPDKVLANGGSAL
jgi:hypothetical protein